MKVLIGVMSCIRDAQNGCHDALRRTWVTRMVPGIDYVIFVGQGDIVLKSDEVQLDINDDYAHLPEKSQAMRKWSLDNGYEFMFKADRDTYLSPQRLLDSGFENYDYSGHFPGYPIPGYLPPLDKTHLDCVDPAGKYPYCSGGCGYWTSKKAMEAIVAAPLDWKRLDNKNNPAEDLGFQTSCFRWGCGVTTIPDISSRATICGAITGAVPMEYLYTYPERPVPTNRPGWINATTYQERHETLSCHQKL